MGGSRAFPYCARKSSEVAKNDYGRSRVQQKRADTAMAPGSNEQVKWQEGGSPRGNGRSTLGHTDRRAARWLFVFLFFVYALSAGGHTYSTDEEAMYAATEALAKTGQPFVEID